MIGGDASGDVPPGIFTPESGSMSVDGLPSFQGGFDFFQDFRVAMQRPGEIHHLTEVFYFGTVEESLHIVAVKLCSRRFKSRGGHAARCSEIEFEWCKKAVVDHEIHSVHSTHVGDLMGIADGGDGSVDNRQAGEFGGDQHGTLYVDVGIDESRKDVRNALMVACVQDPFNGGYPPIEYEYLCGVGLFCKTIHHPACNYKWHHTTHVCDEI